MDGDRSESHSPSTSEHRPCCFDDIPPEIVSGILLAVIDSFGDDTYAKWRFPLLIRRTSRRFHHITTNTPLLWRYLHIRCPVHPYLQNHIKHSAPHALVADVLYGGGPSECIGCWRGITDVVVAARTRLASLTFYTPGNNAPISALLRHEMPVLKVLHVKGTNVSFTGKAFPLSYLPTLLTSFYHFNFKTGPNLPETLEELTLDWLDIDMRPSENFWRLLPKSLRVLRVQKITLEGIVPSQNGKIHLPHLTELCFHEACSGEELSVLSVLSLPRLQHLSVQLDRFPMGPDPSTLSLDFPRLTHVEWGSLSAPPRLANVLRGCSAVSSVYVRPTKRTSWAKESVSDFVTALAEDPFLLPSLKDLRTFGAYISSLKSVVQARPLLTSLEIHSSNLDADSPPEWLPSHVQLFVNHHPEFFPRWGRDL